MSKQVVTEGHLAEIVEAFNRQDLDAIANYFAEDGVFQSGKGPAPGGRRIQGRQQIRNYLAQRYRQFPDWRWEPVRNWTAGERGVAEWTVTGTDESGKRFEWLGCDLFEFENGLIKMKDTYWKAP